MAKMKFNPIRLQDSLIINISGNNQCLVFLQGDSPQEKVTFEITTFTWAWLGMAAKLKLAETCERFLVPSKDYRFNRVTDLT